MRGVTTDRLIDVARILGIALILYGHVIESLMKLGSDSAAFHYEFIYSFHMPLFLSCPDISHQGN